MKKKLLGGLKIIFSCYAWVFGFCSFLIVGTIIIILGVFINPKHFDGFMKLSCRIIVRVIGTRVKVEFAEQLDPNCTYLFMSNHVNIFDGFVLFGFIPHFVRGVELSKHFDWPFYGRIIKRVGMIPISGTNHKLVLQGLRRAKKSVDENTSIIILPEGTRTLDGHFKPFKKGAFLLAREAAVPIIPMVMKGAYEINQKGGFMIRPGILRLRFGKPIDPHSIVDMSTGEILIKVRQTMLEMME